MEDRTPSVPRLVLPAGADTAVPLVGKARLVNHRQWSARTLQLAIGGRETTWTWSYLDLNSRQLVPTVLGSLDNACEHMACEAVRAAIMTCGFAEASDRVWHHARTLVDEFHRLIHGHL